MFKKYPSLTNHYQQKEIDWWLEHFPALSKEHFVITEKIHGANISLITAPLQHYQVASRQRIIPPDESFYSVSEIVRESSTLQYLLSAMQKLSDNLWEPVRLYGELFGPGIQKGVDYGDKKRVLFFDMMVGDELYSWESFWTFMVDADLESLMVPEINTGCTLEQALSEQHQNLETRLGKGIMEGVVIKPQYMTYQSPQGSRFAIKMKNEAFKEKASAPKIRIEDPEIVQLNTKFKAYLTDMRLQAVFSKHGEIESPKEIGKYIKLMLEDAKTNFLKDEDVSHLDKGQLKKVFNVGGTIANMLKGYL